MTFIGTHVGDDPKPRLGGFGKFSGKLTTNSDGTGIESLVMEFETNSLYTQLGSKLTDHLKNADFLDVEKYPNAKFASTQVTAGEDGMLNVVGDFTLMGKTNSITIPVKMTSAEQGVLATGEIKLDRATFGMDKKLEQVSKEVSITLAIGQPTSNNRGGGGARGGKGGEGRGGKGGGRRGDPAAFFNSMDADGDGKLVADEIPERMLRRLPGMDADGDDVITLEEFQTAISNMRSGAGGRGGKGGKGGGGGGAAPRKSRPPVDK